MDAVATGRSFRGGATGVDRAIGPTRGNGTSAIVTAVSAMRSRVDVAAVGHRRRDHHGEFSI